ncbi:MAG: SDR family oxidoreductase [Burkholderiales bacterium]|nr:SDR family oxidoreductase [Burkholderiales bacterium]
MEKNIQYSSTSAHWPKPRLLLIGCGDIGMRLLPRLTQIYRVFALIREPSRAPSIRALGAVPLLGDLDQPASLWRLGSLASYVLHLAPPALDGVLDQRTRNLCHILPATRRLVYVSTSGVYGDCGGVRINESQAVHPVNARAKRRVDAEKTLRAWARRTGSSLAIIRVPGIYAQDRLPLARLEKQLPALLPEQDVYTNHIHAEDLAHILLHALFKARSNRIYHAVDDSEMKMGEYFDAVADSLGFARPPRLPRAEIEQVLSPAMLSFMSESRRLNNQRIKQELGVRLHFPTVASALAKV